MNIIFVGGFYPEIGGPFFALSSLLRKLSKKGIKAKVLSPLPKNYPDEKLSFIKELPFEVEYVRENLPRSIFPSFSVGFFNAIKKDAKNCDLFHLNGVFDFYSIVVSFSNKPYALSLRGSFMKEAYKLTKFKALKKNIFMKLFGDRIINKASLIHVTCKEELENFLYFYPDLREKVRIIPNGLDLSQFQCLPEKGKFFEKYPSLQDKKYVLFLGRINQKKGIDLLIEAFNMFSKESDLYLVIAGEDDGDGYRNTVEKWVKSYGLENRVIFTGLLQGVDKLSAFVDAEVFVLPSYSENFGMAVVEAMACGTPVVISDRVGIAREVQRNNAGVIVETDAKSIYAGIKKILDDANLRKQISENGKKMVKKYYDTDIVADKMIEMYQEVIKISR